MKTRYQSRAFLLFPICFNIGVIIGPIMGGLLADPAKSYPSIFGHVQWMKKYPYAAPNIISAMFLFCSFSGVFFFLKEVRKHVQPLQKHSYLHFFSDFGFYTTQRGFRYEVCSLYSTIRLQEAKT